MPVNKFRQNSVYLLTLDSIYQGIKQYRQIIWFRNPELFTIVK